MKFQARWGKKGFLVSPQKIVPLEGFKTGYVLKDDDKNDTSGKKKTNTRGPEAQKVSFTATYLRAAGVDPRGQYEEWCGELGKSYPLYVGEKRFGPAKMMLKAVDMSNVLLSAQGDFIRVELTLTFTEDTSAQSSTASRKSTSISSASKSKSTYEQTVAKKKAEKNKEAMNASASKDDKAAKKPTTHQSNSGKTHGGSGGSFSTHGGGGGSF